MNQLGRFMSNGLEGATGIVAGSLSVGAELDIIIDLYAEVDDFPLMG